MYKLIVHASQMEDNSRIVDRNTKSYTYGRIMSLWTESLKVADLEQPSTRILWSSRGDSLTFSWAFIEERKFEHEALQQLPSKQILRFEETFKCLFPLDIGTQILGINLQAFEDSATADSPFQMTNDSGCMRLLSDSLCHAFKVDIAAGNLTPKDVLERGQDFLRMFLLCLYSGAVSVPPRSWQTTDLRYATDGNLPRNLRLIDGHGVLVNPKASQSATLRLVPRDDSSLWLLPSRVMLPLLLYLAIFRPVEISLAEKEYPGVPHEELRSYIFWKPGRRSKSRRWSSDNVEHLLKSDGLQMEANACRILLSALLRRHFSSLLQHVDKVSVLDAQSQHSPRTGSRHYAVESLQQVTGTQYTAYEKQILVTQAMHAFHHLLPPIIGIQPEYPSDMPFQNNPLSERLYVNTDYAMMVARSHMVEEYGLASLSQEAAMLQARRLYRTTPFLYGSDEPKDFTAIGDPVLIQVTAALLLGPTIPQGGLPKDDLAIQTCTACAATLVRIFRL